jgi:hypothetical protein
MFYYIGFIFYVIGIKLYNILLVAISPFNKRAKIFIQYVPKSEKIEIVRLEFEEKYLNNGATYIM